MTLSITLYIIICVLLIVFSLLQQGQSGSMGILSGSSSTFLGSEKASVMSRIVSFFAILFFMGAFFLNIISSEQTSLNLQLEATEEEQEQNIDEMPSVGTDEDVVSQPEAGIESKTTNEASPQ